ncbi:MAG: mechanosensitive ion channel family protein [Peptococcaceae bacterium]|jgi:small conductance mechanosensitive channel|nr:mechanosensitive ion channel family protein [Peptococcaceae bacterium]
MTREWIPQWLNPWVESLLLKIILTLLILIGMKLAARICFSLSRRIFRFADTHETDFAQQARTKTIRSILESVVRYLVGFIGAVAILDVWGAPVMAVISAAGIVGVAVGFGAQTLVKDIISGFFILVENQYAVGDFVQLGDIEGNVEALELRTTRIRNINGELHIIPNGSISTVTNYYRGFLRAVVEVGVSYDSNIDQVISALELASQQISGEMGELLQEKPTVSGLWRMDDSALIFRVMVKTVPQERFKVETALRRRVKEQLDRANIQIPYPHHELIIKEAGKPNP